MKVYVIGSCLAMLMLTTLWNNADAQRAPRRRNTTAPATQNGNPANTNTPQQQTNEVKPPSGFNPYGNIPIEVDKSGGGGYNDSVMHKSLRSIDATNKSFQGDRIPLAYEDLRDDDALMKETLWREIDIREKINQPFRYQGEDDNGNPAAFIDILLRSIRRDSAVAFADDRFTQPLTAQEVSAQLASGEPDTQAVRDVNDPNKIVKYVVTTPSFDPKTVTKFRIREQWVFDREASRMFVRIIGIAPLKSVLGPTGEERGVSAMFWLYYPEIRASLAKTQVYNPKNMGYGRMTWEDLFENHMFSSYVTKTQFDNPSNRTIKQLMGKNDPILALLEGENAKERIFNFEQDLWSY
jgi:gliding motility associated protien GldN